MNSPATIDIMMPFYGDVAQFIAAVESVRDQTDAEWRLVIIDDRYPSDEPRTYVERLNDLRISYQLNDKNLGISGNFQRSVDLSTAEYTVIMGCDDIMLPRYVSRIRELITQYPLASYVQPGVVTIDENSDRSTPLADRVKRFYSPRASKPLELSGEQLAVSLLRGNWTYFPSLCWKTSVLREHGFLAHYSIVLDLALQLRIAESGGTLLVDDETVFEYRRHAASASSWSASGGSRFAEEKALFGESAHRLGAIGWHRAARVARAHWSSRLNALAQLPGAIIAGQWAGIRHILTHAVSTTTRGNKSA